MEHVTWQSLFKYAFVWIGIIVLTLTFTALFIEILTYYEIAWKQHKLGDYNV